MNNSNDHEHKYKTVEEGIAEVKKYAPSAYAVLVCECGQEQNITNNFCFNCGKDIR